MRSIVRAESNDLEQCVSILFDSEIGRNYYPRREMLKAELERGLEQDKLYVMKCTEAALSTGADIQGVIWYQPEGIFHAFPYLHMIAVKRECQGKGIGTELLDFFEHDALVNGRNKMRTKVFLTVADFNGGAEALYLRRGYGKLCEIDGLFRKGVTEKLLMKTVAAKK